MEIGQRIDLIRKDLGLSKKAIGDDLRTSRQAVSNWVSGRQNPSKSKADQFCREYGVNMEWLVHGKGKVYVDGRNLGDKPARPLYRRGSMVEEPQGGYVTRQEFDRAVSRLETKIDVLISQMGASIDQGKLKKGRNSA